MISPNDAIEILMEAAARRAELNNLQPFRPQLAVADTIEAQAAELIAHFVRRSVEIGLTEKRLADALDQFFHASIGYAREQKLEMETLQTICAIGTGISAVATHLRRAG